MNRLNTIFIFILITLFANCSGVIYDLTASEYSRLPPLFALDNYEACLEPEDGLYCIVKFDLYSKSKDNELMRIIHEYSAVADRHYNHTAADRGVCVTTTCRHFIKNRDLNNPDQLSAVIEECINDKFEKEYGINAKLALKFYCHKHGEKREIDANDWAFLVFCGVLLGLVFIATVYENYLDSEKKIKEGNQLLLSFSIKSNWEWLTNTECEDERMRSLRGLHGVRTFLNILMISAHSMFFISGGYQNNAHDFERVYNNGWYFLVLNGLVIVQVFFFMSGFLLVYNLHIHSETRKLTWMQIPFIMLKRAFRLTPGMAIAIWFSATWFRFMGDGPLWDLYVTNTVTADCRKYWWHHLLFIQNYVPEDKFCILQTWHIAADTQVFIVGLIVVIATMSKYRNRVLLLLLLLGTLFPALHVWLQNLDPFALVRPDFMRSLNNTTFRSLHVLGHNNLQSFVVGMACAKYVYDWQTKRVDTTKGVWKLYAYLHWLPIPVVALFYYTGGIFYSHVETPVLYKALYAAVHRLFMGVASAYVLVGLAMGVQSWVTRFCESKFWVIPGRLTYGVFILHLNFIQGMLGVRQTTTETSFQYAFILYLGIVLLSYILAIPFHLIVEAPFTRLFKVTTDRFIKKPKEVTVKEANGKKIN